MFAVVQAWLGTIVTPSPISGGGSEAQIDVAVLLVQRVQLRARVLHEQAVPVAPMAGSDVSVFEPASRIARSASAG